MGVWYLRALSLEESFGRTGGVQSELSSSGVENQRIGALGFEGILLNRGK